MSGETNLDTLLRSMQPILQTGTYVFAKVEPLMETAHLEPRMIFEESEGKTLILLEETAISYEVKHEFPCRMITLNIHSALDAVGFIAAITTKLANLGMGVNPVAAFHHDHLFVPAGRADDAMHALNELSTAIRLSSNNNR